MNPLDQAEKDRTIKLPVYISIKTLCELWNFVDIFYSLSRSSDTGFKSTGALELNEDGTISLSFTLTAPLKVPLSSNGTWHPKVTAILTTRESALIYAAQEQAKTVTPLPTSCSRKNSKKKAKKK